MGLRGGWFVAQPTTVLVADSSDERRRQIGLALYEGGYEVINAVNGEEALRFTAGLDPSLVIAHTGLESIEPVELYRRVKGTGLSVPPMMILTDGELEIPDDLDEGQFYVLRSEGLDPGRFLLQIRLLMLARDTGGELSDSIDRLYGDLTRISIGDLLRVLQKHIITGHVRLSLGPDTGLMLTDGNVVDAHWSGVTGRKAFNRVAGLRGGSFRLDLEDVTYERRIDVDLATLVSDAVDEKFALDEAFRRLPSLNSRVGVSMGQEFFATQFSEVEQTVLGLAQSARNLADLIDAVPESDLETVKAIEGLAESRILSFTEPEHRIHIVTDSTCDLHRSVTRRLGITVVPLSVIFGSQVYKDGVDLMPDDFYTKLRESETFPSTSPPGKGEFADTYANLVPSGDIVSIHISSLQSETFKNAAAAWAENESDYRTIRADAGSMRRPECRMVDSKVNSVGLGLLVLLASRMAQKGLSVEEIGAKVEDISSRLQFLFAVNTLEYLRKGGRIGGGRALMGSILGIKPILGMEGGEVVAVDKVRGGRKTQPKLIELFKKRMPEGQPIMATVAHASAPKWAGRLKELVHEHFEVAEFFEGMIGPVVGAHAGPGCVGCVMFAPTPEELELFKVE
jgi:DegV family protein with EDD domain